MKEIMEKGGENMTSGDLRKILADAMQKVITGDMHKSEAQMLIGLATQFSKTMDAEIKQQVMCLKCKHKLDENHRP